MESTKKSKQDNRLDQSIVFDQKTNNNLDQEIELETRPAQGLNPSRAVNSAVVTSRQETASDGDEKLMILQKLCKGQQKLIGVTILTCVIISLIVVISALRESLSGKGGARVDERTADRYRLLSNRSPFDLANHESGDDEKSSPCGRSVRIRTSTKTTAASESSWITFTSDDAEWPSIARAFNFTATTENKSIGSGGVSIAVLSPFYRVPNNTCGMEAGVERNRRRIVDSVVVRSEEAARVADIGRSHDDEQSACARASVHDPDFFLAAAGVVQFAALMTARDDYDLTIDFRRCNNFKSLEDYPTEVVDARQASPVVHDVDRRCSFEYEPALMCRWLRLVDPTSSGEFKHVQSSIGIGAGLRSQPRGDKWFVALTPTPHRPSSRAYLVSPLMRRLTSHVTLSFYFQMMGDAEMNVYVVDQHFDVELTVRTAAPARHVTGIVTDGWTPVHVDITVPSRHQRFYIIIEGRIGSLSSVEKTCRIGNKQLSTNVSMVAIDDITIRHVQEQCTNHTSQNNTMDCCYSGTDRLCAWKSSGEDNYFTDWDLVKDGKQRNDSFGLLGYHMKDKDLVMRFDTLSKAGVETSFLRSPLLIANTNCSCNLNITFLMRGEYVPRMTLVAKYGEDQHNDSRPHARVWSASGHQADDWVQAGMRVNLQADDVPFQFEIRLYEINDGRGNIFIHSIKFDRCDISFYADAVGYDPVNEDDEE